MPKNGPSHVYGNLNWSMQKKRSKSRIRKPELKHAKKRSKSRIRKPEFMHANSFPELIHANSCLIRNSGRLNKYNTCTSKTNPWPLFSDHRCSNTWRFLSVNFMLNLNPKAPICLSVGLKFCLPKTHFFGWECLAIAAQIRANVHCDVPYGCQTFPWNVCVFVLREGQASFLGGVCLTFLQIKCIPRSIFAKGY